MVGAEGHPRHHGVPPRPWRRHVARGPDLQDVRRRCDRAHQGEPVPPCARRPGHRLRHRRRACAEARHREDRGHPRPGGHRLCLDAGDRRGPVRPAARGTGRVGHEAARGAGRDRGRRARGRARRRHGGGRRDGGPRLHLPGVAAHDGASAGRLDSVAGGWGAALAGHRRGEGAPVGRAEAGPRAGGPAAGSGASGHRVEAARHHRRPRRGQDDDCPRHPRDPRRQARPRDPLCADGPGGKAPDRDHGPRGEDHPPAARGESGRRPLPARALEPARHRPARRRRGVDGGRAAHARARPRGAAASGGHLRRGRRPVAVGRPRPGARRHHRLRRGAGRPPDGGLPPGRRQPHHRQRPPREPRGDAGALPRRRTRRRTSTSSRSRAPRKGSPRSSRSSPSASPSGSASTPCATCRCSAR